MSIAVVLALASAAAGAVVGMTSSALSGSPGWRELRWISLAAWTASAFAICSVVSLLTSSPRIVIVATGLQFALAALHVVAWLLHSAPLLGLSSRGVRLSLALLLPLALLLAIPGLAFSEPIRFRTVAWLGSVYRDPSPTAFAHAASAVLVAVMLVLAALHLGAWRRGVARARVSAFAIIFLSVAGAQDSLAMAGWIDTPDLLAPSALIPVVAVAWLIASRFVSDARGLARLRVRLQRRIRARTRVLALSRDALHRTDALAAIGLLARRAAHEVNNPAASVTANLAYASEQLASGSLQGETGSALADARDSLRRLHALAVRLSDAGGAEAEAPRRVPLALAVRDAVAMARAHEGSDVRVDVDVDAALATEGDRALLCRAIENLVGNGLRAAAAAHPAGSVSIRATRSGDWILLRIDDTGHGMDELVMRRLGEPFFTTRPFERQGLGVAVARALIRSLGGRLRFVSERGAGTSAIVELPARAPTAPPKGLDAPTVTA